MGSLDRWVTDLRQGVRALQHRRAVAVTGALTLGLGIAAVSIVFSVFDAVVLRAIPGPYADRLMRIGFTSPTEGPARSSLTHAAVEEVAARHDVFDVAASWQRTVVQWSDQRTDSDLLAFSVSTRYFDLFGVPAARGRTFARDESQPGNSAVVVLADRFWRAELGADPAVIGRVLTLNHEPTRVIGVMPASFDLPNVNVQAWVPDVNTPEEVSRTAGDHFGIGRLRAGLSVEKANDALARVLPQRSVEYGIDLVFAVTPLRDQLVGPVGRILGMMTGAVGLVLAIACANVAILLLVAGRSRVRETAVRLALGASRLRLFRQSLIESLLLGVAGCVLGVGLTELGVRMVRALGPVTIPRLGTAVLTWNVLIVAATAAVVASIAAGLAPALMNMRVHLGVAVDDGAIMTRRGISVAGARRSQWLLALAQLALVTVLVVGSGLLVRSLVRLLTVDVGWDTNNVIGVQTGSRMIAGTQRPMGPLPDADTIVSDLRRIPNVEDAAMLKTLPTGRGGMFVKEQYQTADAEWKDTPYMRDQCVTDTFFDLLRMRLSHGRFFNASDVQGGPRVVIVNEAFAAVAWPRQNPIGKHVGSPRFPAEVVGVVNNVRYDLGSDSEPQVYYPWRQRCVTQAIVVRYRAGAPSPQQEVLEYLKRLEPANAVGSAGPLGGLVRKATVEPRFYAVSLSLFAAIALLLAAVGVYGVSAHMVAQRTREFGVRLALGARPRDLRQLVMRSSAMIAVIGIAVGVGGAWALTGILKALLFEISALDAVTFAVAPVVVALTALLAAWVPARRAGKIDPSHLLRAE